MNRWTWLLILGSCGFWTSCDDVEGGAEVDAEQGCEVCHTPADLGPTHQTHNSADLAMMGGTMLCSECHPMDAEWNASGHMNREVEVGFSESVWAGLGGSQPTFTGERCENVYCHGATLSGGTTPSPAWNTSVESLCGMCHSLPPTENHVDEDNCEDCHSSAYTEGNLNENHLNGTVNLYGAD